MEWEGRKDVGKNDRRNGIKMEVKRKGDRACTSI